MAASETILNGRYRLIQQQGAGGMAVVYQAEDLALSRNVAVKILRPSLTEGDQAEQFLVRFRQEARNAANLSHPNIVVVHDVGQDGATYYMVMEFIDGQDLKRLIRSSGPFPVERALHIAIQMCAGLGYAHRAKLVHADVKPQNTLITGADVVKITDFGIAQAFSHTQPQTDKQGVVWGSPHYFSPEQARGEQPTPASDVYAIGVVLFELLTGRLPYSGSSGQELALAHVRDQVPHARDFNASVPQNIDWVVHKVMSKEPEQRYRTADQLGRILVSYAKQLESGISEAPAEVGPTPPAAPNKPAAINNANPKTTAPAPASFGTLGNSSNSKPVAPPATSAAPPVGASAAKSQPVAPVPEPATKPPLPYTPQAVPVKTEIPYVQTRPAGSQPAPYAPPPPAMPSSPAIVNPPPVALGGGGLPKAPGNSGYTPYPPAESSNNINAASGTGSGNYFSQGYSQPYATGSTRPEVATVLLLLLAVVAVFGLVILWLFVWNAYIR
jgi:eukaryotic-like serine/threonine-protein kinase